MEQNVDTFTKYINDIGSMAYVYVQVSWGVDIKTSFSNFMVLF